MDKTAKSNFIKIVGIPLVIALGLAGLGITIFERVTGISAAIHAYQEGEEKCRKYGLFAPADELNQEYNIPSETKGGKALKLALAQYNKEEGSTSNVWMKLDLSATPDTHSDEHLESLENFWKALEPTIHSGAVRFPRDFREGYAMLLPEYAYVGRVCTHSLNTAVREPDIDKQLKLLSEVSWLRRQIGQDISSDFAASASARIQLDEMDTVRVLIKRFPNERRFVRLGEELLASEPVPTGIEFRLKADLNAMFQILEPGYPIENVLPDLGLKVSDPHWENWLKWRRYPRSTKAWKSTAMDIVSYGYEEFKRNPPKNLEEYFKFRARMDDRQMRFGYAPAVGWSSFHLIGLYDSKPFREAQDRLRQEIAKHS